MSAVVYRLIGPLDSLLYVGVTGDFTERLRRHRSTSVFGHLIERWEVETHHDRASALDAERAAIAGEAPLFNDRLNGHAAPPLIDGVGVIVHSLARRRGLSTHELAKEAHMPHRRLLRCLADRKAIRIRELARIAEVLGTTAGAIVTEWEAAA
jgi:hypothetical protein